MLKNLEELINIIRNRKKNPKSSSYTNKLLNNKKLSIEKIKEEIGELVDAINEDSNKILKK